MPVVVVANPKGGVGKSTMATQVAGYYASKGHSVMLGDADRQQSTKLWLGLRPPAARPISTWEVGEGNIAKPPKGTTHVVLDTPAGMHGKMFKEVMQLADKVMVPLLHEFVDSLGLPVLGYLRHTQNYIHLAARGLTIFDVAPGRVERDLSQWEGICRWLDK
jgi:chromosome partitioning protein